MKTFKNKLGYALCILLAVVLTAYVILSSAMAWQYCEETLGWAKNTPYAGIPIGVACAIILCRVWKHYR